jgi:hypothetical protein
MLIDELCEGRLTERSPAPLNIDNEAAENVGVVHVQKVLLLILEKIS